MEKEATLIQKLGTISEYKSVGREKGLKNGGDFAYFPKLTSKTIQY